MTTTTSETRRTKPSHRLYVVTGEGDNEFWKEIAAAWTHRNGKGFSILCDVLPLSGRIVMRQAKERTATAKA